MKFLVVTAFLISLSVNAFAADGKSAESGTAAPATGDAGKNGEAGKAGDAAKPADAAKAGTKTVKDKKGDGIPAYVKADSELLAAWNTGNATIRSYIKKQHDSKQSLKLKAFRTNLRAMMAEAKDGKTVEMPKMQPASSKTASGNKAVPSGDPLPAPGSAQADRQTEAKPPCLTCRNGGQPMSEKQLATARQLGGKPALEDPEGPAPGPAPVPYQPEIEQPRYREAPVARTEGVGFMSDSSSMLQMGVAALIGGGIGYMIGKNSGHNSQMYGPGYGFGMGGPGMPFWGQQPMAPRFALPGAYPAPGAFGLGGPMGYPGTMQYPGMMVPGMGMGGIGMGGMGGITYGGLSGAPIARPYPGPSLGYAQPSYGFGYGGGVPVANIYNMPGSAYNLPGAGGIGGIGGVNYTLPSIVQPR